jgi:hypothetical protein
MLEKYIDKINIPAIASDCYDKTTITFGLICMIYLFRLMVKLELEKYLVSIPFYMFLQIYGFYLLIPLLSSIIKLKQSAVHIPKFSSSSLYHNQVSSFELVVDNFFTYIIDTDNCTDELSLLCPYFIEIVLKNFIDEFNFPLEWIQKNAFLQICLAKIELVYVYH